MRSRKEILDEQRSAYADAEILEVLLDIRDLLMPKKKAEQQEKPYDKSMEEEPQVVFPCIKCKEEYSNKVDADNCCGESTDSVGRAKEW